MAKLWIEGGSIKMFLPIEERVAYGDDSPRVFCLDTDVVSSPKMTKRERFRVACVQLKPGVQLVDVTSHVSKAETVRYTNLLSPRQIVITLEEIQIQKYSPVAPAKKSKSKKKGKK